MISKEVKKEITQIWASYIASNKKVLDVKGNEFSDIDSSRIKAIEELKEILNSFLTEAIDVSEFKTSIDSYNKRNNLWGFTATKGQMFFNQLLKQESNGLEEIEVLLRKTIIEPLDLREALRKIDLLDRHCQKYFNKAKDKRKVANPGSVGYFLSYFWQLQNHEKWPIIYTSLITAFEQIGVWETNQSQKDTYEYFFNLNNNIKSVIEESTIEKVSYWDAEHAFWNYSGNPNQSNRPTKAKEGLKPVPSVQKEIKIPIKANFLLEDYIIPKVARLVEVGNNTDKSASSKGSEFEKLVAEIFQQLDFEVDMLGQGKGRNPDAILKFPEEHTAFLVDAKAYSSDYTLGVDDRAIREYISHYCPKLKKQGFTKIGFILVSNSFKSSFDSFIQEITWETDIKRFILLTSEALLYLLAYKTKDKQRLSLSTLIASLVSFRNPVGSETIIQGFDDI